MRGARRKFLAGLALYLGLGAPMASAHPFDEGIFVSQTAIHLATDAPHDRLISLYIRNNDGAAVTLRGLRAEGYAISIERKRSLFGFESWQPVDFLRVDPREIVILDIPDYRIRAVPERGQPPFSTATELWANFGPLGEVFALPIPMRGQQPSWPSEGGPASPTPGGAPDLGPDFNPADL